MAENQYLIDHYTKEFEDGRLASRHGSVEFLTTMRYVERCLKPGGRIVEIGAGTGRYSHALARKGYAVDAIELVPHNIDIFRENTQPGEAVTVTEGNALDLSAFGDGSYDITLLLGSMYHLYTKADKLQALREAIRVTKAGGVVFAAYCISDPSILGYGFIRGHIFELIEKGMLDTTRFKAVSTPRDIMELVRKEDIDGLMRGFPIKRLHYIGTDGYTLHMRETVDSMDDKTFELYLQYHFTICERQDMVGFTHHSLDIFQKL